MCGSSPTAMVEPWTEYLLEDGTVIRFRATMMSIVRVSNTWTPSGEPVYQWQHQTSTVVVSPDHLKQHAVPVEQEKAVVQ